MKYVPLFSLVILILGSCGSEEAGGGKTAPELDYQKHTAPTDLAALELKLRGDTLPVDPTYDLYFDFSSTMKRAVSDKAYSDLITAAIFESDNQTNCYVIGENPALKAVTGDNTIRKNTFLVANSYTQKNTFMTPNLDNIVAHPQRPAIMFTDFSVDEKQAETQFDGVTSTFVRGPKFRSQFSAWFSKGGSIRIYGKRSSVEGQNMPIYVIAFIPSGMEPGHKANNILNQLESNLRDIYFNFHPRFVSVEATPNEGQMSDYLGFSMRNKAEALPNGIGEMLLYDGKTLLSKVKGDSKKAAVSFFDGLAYKLDSTSFYSSPLFELDVKEFKAESKTVLSTNLKDAIGFFKSVSVTPECKFLIPLSTTEARLDKYYKTPRFFRVAINVKAGSLNIDDKKASNDLAYPLKSGGKTLLNNCLYESIIKGLNDALSNNPPRTVYTICAFVKGPPKNS